MEPETPETPVAVPPPVVVDNATRAYVTKGLSVGLRQLLLMFSGTAIAHKIFPSGFIDDGNADLYIGVGVFVLIAAWGQYREANQHSKLVVLADSADDLIGRVINMTKASRQ